MVSRLDGKSRRTSGGFRLSVVGCFSRVRGDWLNSGRVFGSSPNVINRCFFVEVGNPKIGFVWMFFLVKGTNGVSSLFYS